MQRTAVVTGAGSGVGRAITLKLAALGWSVALVGRREEPLRETVALTGAAPGTLLVCPTDVGDPAAVTTMGRTVLQNYGGLSVLVNAAGTNTPRRSLAELRPEDYRLLMDTNLNGAYYCVQAFLPAMRQAGSGTIVNIVSDAGLRASAKAGVAYVVSKFGLSGLTQAINAEEREHGIRACAIYPGDIDTAILDRRPVPPPTEARQKMLKPEDVAACVLLAISLPPHAVIEELVVRPL